MENQQKLSAAPSSSGQATIAVAKEEAEDSAVVHYLKGVGSFAFLIVFGALYWLVMLWDVKGIGRRSRHYRIKLNNTWRSFFDRPYVERNSALRQGDCAHCGACCEILWRCPFLRTDKEGNSRCVVHKNRPLPCRTFPIDLKTVELISKDRPADQGCSYIFQQRIDDKRREIEAQQANNSPQA